MKWRWTHADFPILTEETFHGLQRGNRGLALTDFSSAVVDHQMKPVDVVGACSVHVQNRGVQGTLRVLVAKGTHTNLMGVQWFRPLGIAITGVSHIQKLTVDTVLTEFSDVFEKGLGNYVGPQDSLHLDPSVPPAPLKARRLLFAIQPKVEHEFDHLIEQGVPEPVMQPTSESPIVTVLKSNGDIRICGDYKSMINKALKQHPYPIPAVNHLLLSLTGGKFFAGVP